MPEAGWGPQDEDEAADKVPMEKLRLRDRVRPRPRRRRREERPTIRRHPPPCSMTGRRNRDALGVLFSIPSFDLELPFAPLLDRPPVAATPDRDEHTTRRRLSPAAFFLVSHPGPLFSPENLPFSAHWKDASLPSARALTTGARAVARGALAPPAWFPSHAVGAPCSVSRERLPRVRTEASSFPAQEDVAAVEPGGSAWEAHEKYGWGYLPTVMKTRRFLPGT